MNSNNNELFSYNIKEIRIIHQHSSINSMRLLNDKRIMELYNISKATGVDYSFNISIDGLSEETFSACRPNADFKKVLSNLNLIQKLFTYVDVTFTVKRPNIKDVPNVENFFKDNDIGAIFESDIPISVHVNDSDLNWYVLEISDSRSYLDLVSSEESEFILHLSSTISGNLVLFDSKLTCVIIP